ncbi:unnamed protein product [Parajaminaea phylloscopi]
MPQSQPTVPLGGTASNLEISRISLGLMGLTWVDESSRTPDEEAFATIRAAIDAGVKLLDAGEFYGPPSDVQANLKLVRRYFQRYPEDREKVVLCVKGGMNLFGPGSYSDKGMAGLAHVVGVEGLRQHLLRAREALGCDDAQYGKDIDLWEPARWPQGVSVEDMVPRWIQLRDEGLFKHLALSEVKGSTVEAAVKASNNGIAAVEIEYSPFMREAEDQGVVDVCEKHKIPILAYSPVGKGILSGELRSRSDLPAGDPRLHQDRFTEENLAHNVQLADEFHRIAKEKGISASQLVLAWILARSPILTAIPGTRRPERARDNAEAAHVQLTAEELKSINGLIDGFAIKGGRYSEAARQHQNLWG